MADAQVKIVSIKDIDFLTRDVSGLIDSGQDIKQGLNLAIRAQHKVDPEKHLFTFRMQVEFTKDLGEKELTTLLRYTIQVDIEIANFAEVILTDVNGQYTVPDYLLDILAVNTQSTMRGILLEKTANSYLKDLYLPISFQRIKNTVENAA